MASNKEELKNELAMLREEYEAEIPTEVVKTPELAALVKQVRALAKKSQRISAAKLVRERTDYGLHEALKFVQHVQAWPGTKAEKVVELWVRTTRNESIANPPEPEPQTAATRKEESKPLHNCSLPSISIVKVSCLEAPGLSCFDFEAASPVSIQPSP